MMGFASLLIVSTSTLRVGSNSFKHSIEIQNRQKHLDKNNQEDKNKKATRLFIIIASLIALVETAGLPSFNFQEVAGQAGTGAPVVGGTNSDKLSLSSLVQQGSPMRGSPSAPVAVIEFGDFQCDKCARFARESEPQLNQAYIQTGRVILVFKHFPIHGPDSKTAAVASQCANDQGKFWDFDDILFSNQGPENSGWASADNLKKFAGQIYGLDTQKFNSCLDSEKYKSLVT